MDLVFTAEVTAADGTDDNDADGNSERDNSMVGQWERRPRRSRSSKRGLKDGGEASTCSCSSVPGRFCTDSTLALRNKKGQVGIREGSVVPITVTKGLGTAKDKTKLGACCS